MHVFVCSCIHILAGAKTGRSPLDKRVVEETGAPDVRGGTLGILELFECRANRFMFRVKGLGLMVRVFALGLEGPDSGFGFWYETLKESTTKAQMSVIMCLGSESFDRLVPVASYYNC